MNVEFKIQNSKFKIQNSIGWWYKFGLYNFLMSRAIVWFRRDLRLDDHTAIHFASLNYSEIIPIFVFDTVILQQLINKSLLEDRRVYFIVARLKILQKEIVAAGGQMIFAHGDPLIELPSLAQLLKVDAVICHHDYEPEAIKRDHEVYQRLNLLGIKFLTFKDQVIFERDQVLNQSGKHFAVFTPYKNAWLNKLRQQLELELGDFTVQRVPWLSDYAIFAAKLNTAIPSWSQLGFIAPAQPDCYSDPQRLWQSWQKQINSYHQTRDFPALALQAGHGTSQLSVHLRFGTISIRKLVRYAWNLLFDGNKGGEMWLSELIWREFYFSLLWHRPNLVNECFRHECNNLCWENTPLAQKNFLAWCAGMTGYPLVDAGMRQLLQTGWMHNRVRMVTASFLTKDLGIDWRLGERYFADYLLDYDLSANNGGWQWSASTGCDAQPWFRIFNPTTQAKTFDPNGEYIRKFCPELAAVPTKYIHLPWLIPDAAKISANFRVGKNYPLPIVEHSLARIKTLARFKALENIR